MAEIAATAESAWGTVIPRGTAERLAELSGGVPWLVDILVQSTGPDRDSLPPFDSSEAVRRVGQELETVPDRLRELLVALAVGFDVAGELPSALGESPDEVDYLLAQARLAGLLRPDGRLVPLVRQALLTTTPAYRLRPLQHALVDAVIAEGLSLDEVAESLAHAGLRDLRVAGVLEQEGDSVLGTQPALAAELYREAHRAGSEALSTAARRAQAASALGDLDGAARILDELFAHDDAPDLGRAVDVASAVWAGRGMLERSAEIYRWFGPERMGESAPLAAVAMLGVGDLDSAKAMLDATPSGGTPTMLSVATALMAQGMRASVEDTTEGALPALIRASDMMTAAGVVTPLPEVPAALAALVALHSGELAVAESVITRALAGGQGGAAARPRLLLFRAWAEMQADHTAQAHTAIEQAVADAGGLAARDELLLRALEVGLARRADDAPALVRAWQRARESILHVPIDLLSLLPFGELVVSATRLGDSAWLDAPLADAWRLLAKLGDPPLWSVPLHWCAVQAAILAERPAELAPHAAALVRASAHSHVAAVCAAAGKVWIVVRAGQFDVSSVEDAARGLASIGHTWEGSRLAGHAAARTEERKDMARLLACARSLHPGSAGPAPIGFSTAGTSVALEKPATSAGTQRDGAGLSAREREVARLVLEGNTYGEIGEAIFISPRTVEHHVARIRRQLGVNTRSELLTELRYLLDASEPQD